MKILFLIHRIQARGQEIFACQLAQELCNRGYTVKVWSLYDGEFSLSFPVASFGFKSSKELWKSSSWKKLRDCILDFGPELIQANGGDTLKFLMLSNFRYNFDSKVLFNNGGVVSYYFKSFFQRVFYRFLFQKLSGVISVSAFSDRDLLPFIPSQTPRAIIPIAIEAPNYKEDNLQSQIPVFVHIGGFTEEKNQLFSLEVFQTFQQKHPLAELHFYGDGPLLPKVKEIAKGLDKVFFHGSIQDPWSKIQKSCILVLPSKIEGTPAVIAEALVGGVPVLANAVGGIPEMCEGFESCYLLEEGTKISWIRAMEEIAIRKGETWENLKKADQKKAKKNFSMQKSATYFIHFYQSL